jgi:hypothetical protein
MRKPAARTKPRTAKIVTYPAPVGGWIKNQNLAVPGARRPDGSAVNGAAMLENWFPIATGIRMRAGSEVYQPLSDFLETIVSMFTYVNGNNEKLFAATATGIYDTTIPTLPLLLVDDLGNSLVDDLGNDILSWPTAPPLVAVVTSTGGEWSVVQFATPGGVFLRAVNGIDTPEVYDGTNWSTSPAITGVDPTTLSYAFVYKQRLFFIQKDSLTAWYLPVDSIGGAAVELPLGGVFTRGGSLLFGASWSIDGGGGLSAQCIFVTTEGECAVYQGSDPSVAASWNLVGVYRIGKPMGPKAWIHAGGDLVIATDVGFVPLSQAVQRDYAALSPSAISYPIETAWNEAVAARSGEFWHCEVWPSKQMVLIALPTLPGTAPQMFVANARTGAWALFTGWDATCVQLFGERLFFGSTLGRVVEAETTGADQEAVYTSTCVPLFDPLKNPASLKTGMAARATLLSPLRVAAGLSFQHDFTISLPPAPDDIVIPSGSLWGIGIWGTSQWGAAAVKQTFQEWKSIGGSGYSVAPAVQISSGSIVPPDVELVTIDMTYELGDIVT